MEFMCHIMKQFSEEHRQRLSIARRKRIMPPHSEEHKQKIKQSCKGINKGNKNGNWKDKPKYTALHIWVRDHLPKPEYCKMCGLTKSYDLANITGIYNRESKNWMYMCRKCHMISDNRLSVMIDRNHRRDYKYNPNRDPITGRFIKSSCAIA